MTHRTLALIAAVALLSFLAGVAATVGFFAWIAGGLGHKF